MKRSNETTVECTYLTNHVHKTTELTSRSVHAAKAPISDKTTAINYVGESNRYAFECADSLAHLCSVCQFQSVLNASSCRVALLVFHVEWAKEMQNSKKSIKCFKICEKCGCVRDLQSNSGDRSILPFPQRSNCFEKLFSLFNVGFYCVYVDFSPKLNSFVFYRISMGQGYLTMNQGHNIGFLNLFKTRKK